MKRLIVALVALVALTVTADAAKRKNVRIYKQSPPAVSTQPVYRGVAVVPVVGVAFDLIRRTSCDPAIAVSTGPGDPGFDPAGPKTGNFLIPAIYRSECQPVPTPQKRRRG